MRRYREHARVDMHAHYLAPAYVDALHAVGITTLQHLPIPQWTPTLAMRFMDTHGVAFQMLSVSAPGVAFLHGAQAITLAQQCNDYIAAVVRQHPHRFGALAVLPVDEPTTAAREVNRALGQLKLDGVGLLSSHNGRYLGDPFFDPVLTACNQHRAWVFVHPTTPSVEPSYGLPDFVAEFPFDTTRAFISLLFNNCFARYPHIRWQFAHGGGTIPMLRSRLISIAAAAKQFGALLGLPPNAASLTKASPDHALRTSFYDTALLNDPTPLRAIAEVAGDDQLVFGSDWPFAAVILPANGDPEPALSLVFDNRQRHRIDRRNARQQFERLSFLPA
jgi:predicted TIM-barrel fold metal-dependent hydrolase